jgi:hypothetical protein
MVMEYGCVMGFCTVQAFCELLNALNPIEAVVGSTPSHDN